MPHTIQTAQPPLEFITPEFHPWVLQGSRWALPVALRSLTMLRAIHTEQVERLVELYRQFQSGNTRFLIAFRHPSTDDPFCIAHLLWRSVPALARQSGIPLQHPVHAHFIYDRGIPLWAGGHVGWLYSRLGGTPIRRGRVDLAGLRSARNLFANGQFPIAAAPEGATNGHTEVVSPLEPGVSQLAFWCVEDLLQAGRSETVLIVPIGIQYRYLTPPWAEIAQLLQGLEADTGLPHPATPATDLNDATLYQRLYRLGTHLLMTMEDFYARFYHQDLPTVKPTSAGSETIQLSNEEFAARLTALLNAALRVAEQYFNLQPKGNVTDRCRRIEQAGWDYIYRENFKSLETLPTLERRLADRVAEEADLRLWHMRIVESFVAVTGKYVLEKPSVERFAETSLLMWDMLARIKGQNPFERPKLGAQEAFLTVGEPISVSERWSSYSGGRRQAKQAVEALTQDLQTIFDQMAIRPN